MKIPDTIGRAQQVVQQARRVAEAVADAVRGAGGLEGPRLETVRYAFRVPNGPDPDWHVRRVKITEGISQPYEIVVDVLTDELATATDDLLGADAEFEIERGELLRTIYGVIHRVDYIGVTVDRLLVRCYVVPALRLASQRIDTRIFQDVTVLEVVQQVLGPALAVYGRTYDPAKDEIADPAVYPKRDYCVQYGESDLDFVARLLEEEGIAYFFEPDHDAKKERLVLVDHNEGYRAVPVLMDSPVPIIPERVDDTDRESLRNFDWCQPAQVNKVVVWQHNWKVAGDPRWPVTALEGAALVSSPPRGHVRESYLHGDRRKIVDQAGDEAFAGELPDDLEVQPQAVRRLDLMNHQAKRGQGRSNVTGFMAGGTFELANHGRDDLENQKYLLVRCIHTGDCPDAEHHGAGAGEDRYDNSFECIPVELPYRPPLVTRRPRIYGPQTAIVTGSGSEEIHTDAFGRIKVKFHWDRLSPTDDTSSAWVRVAQSWAGPGWGTMFIPRVGMEVVVEFLEGNPDRPLVTGCVYNAFTSTPFPLPQEKTKSTIKSQSSPSKTGYNELTFEDLAGSEQIILHAQKDLNEKVEHCHTMGVGANQTIDVGGDQKVTVTGSQFITVKGKNQGPFKGSQTEVTGKYVVNASELIAMKAPQSVKIECPGSYILLEPGRITIHAGDGASVVLDAKVLAKAAGKAQLQLDTDVGAKSADDSVLTLDAKALVKSSGGSKLFLDGDALLKANSGAKLVLDPNVLVDGGEVTVDGKKAAIVKAPDTKIGDGVVTVTGSSVTIDGGGATGKFAGGLVKLN